jgi:hypothetical protein
MSKLKLLFMAVLATLAVGQFASRATQVYAQSDAAICEGIGAVEGGSSCNDPSGSTTINTTLAAVLNILSIAAGIAAVIMIIIAGIRYITSNGEANNVAGAKNALIYAIVGIVIVALAQVIVRFAVNRLDDRPPQQNGSPNLCEPDGTNPDPTRQCAI